MRRFDDACVAVYKEQLDEDGQVDFKGKAKAFVRAYGFLASILPYTHAEWEKLSIFLNFLVPKLPAPVDEDLSKGILESIDMDSYRVEKKAAMQVNLTDEDAEIEHDEALRRVMTRIRAQRRHATLQAVQRQRVVPPVADGQDLLTHLRGHVGMSSGIGFVRRLAASGGRAGQRRWRRCRAL